MANWYDLAESDDAKPVRAAEDDEDEGSGYPELRL